MATNALVVRVMHSDNGEVAVRVWDEPSEAKGELAFSGSLAIPSRVLRFSDALGEEAIDVDVPSGRAEVDIFTNDPAEASEVHVVLAEREA